jgi:hypothetical protein
MVRDKARLERGHDDQSRRGHQCSETTLKGESRFHISTPGTPTKRPPTKRPRLQNVLSTKRPSTKRPSTERPAYKTSLHSKRPRLQNVPPTKRPSLKTSSPTKRPCLQNVLPQNVLPFVSPQNVLFTSHWIFVNFYHHNISHLCYV